MDGRGGCCIARCGGGGGRVYDMSKVDRIMLKFRPIAPKPVAAGSLSGGSTTKNGDGYVRSGRGKRRYVRSNSNNKKKDGKDTDNNNNNKGRTVGRKRKVSASSSPLPSESVCVGGDAVVTLSLLPETPDRKENSPARGSASDNSDLVTIPSKKVRKFNSTYNKSPILLNFNNHQQTITDGHVMGGNRHVVAASDQAVVMIPPPQLQRQQVVSFVTVECVTDTWVNGEWLGCSDEERVGNMDRDTCPGFVSDGRDRVVWTNQAYREMVGSGHVAGEEMVVWLVRKDNWVTLPAAYPAFTCKVRVTYGGHSHQYNRRTASSPSTLTVPCDVWRMESGGYAWRLDVKAALCLGR